MTKRQTLLSVTPQLEAIRQSYEADDRATAIKRHGGRNALATAYEVPPPARGPPLTENPDPLLLPAEVRAIVRLSQPTIDRLRRKKQFPEPLVIGLRRIAWRSSWIYRWLGEREQDAETKGVLRVPGSSNPFARQAEAIDGPATLIG
jgi:predicted DNA-binding transcriptional regulator AlpA